MAKKQKNKNTFAEEASRIMKKYERRLGEDLDKPDKYAREALEMELRRLADKQEEVRSQSKGNTMNNTTPKYVTGGPIRYTPADNNMTGGLFNTSPYADPYRAANTFTGGFEGSPIYNSRGETNIANAANITGGLETPTINISPSDTIPVNGTSSATSYNPYEYSMTPSLIGAGASAAGNIANALFTRNAMDNLSEIPYIPYVPEDVDLSASRAQSRAEGLNARRAALNEIRKGGSEDYSSLALQAILAGDRNLSSILSQSRQQEDIMNTQQRNQAGQFNVQNRTNVASNNAQLSNRKTALGSQAVSEAIANITGAAQGVVGDYQQGKQYENNLQFLSENYIPVIDPNTGRMTYIPRNKRERYGV